MVFRQLLTSFAELNSILAGQYDNDIWYKDSLVYYHNNRVNYDTALAAHRDEPFLSVFMDEETRVLRTIAGKTRAESIKHHFGHSMRRLVCKMEVCPKTSLDFAACPLNVLCYLQFKDSMEKAVRVARCKRRARQEKKMTCSWDEFKSKVNYNRGELLYLLFLRLKKKF